LRRRIRAIDRNSFVGRVFRVDPSDGSAVQVANAGLLLSPRGIAVYRVPESGFFSGLVASTILPAGLAPRRIKRSSELAFECRAAFTRGQAGELSRGV